MEIEWRANIESGHFSSIKGVSFFPFSFSGKIFLFSVGTDQFLKVWSLSPFSSSSSPSISHSSIFSPSSSSLPSPIQLKSCMGIDIADPSSLSLFVLSPFEARLVIGGAGIQSFSVNLS